MKKIIYIFITLMVFSLGCTKEDVLTVDFETKAHFTETQVTKRPLFTQAGQVERESVDVTLLGTASSSAIDLNVAVDAEASTAVEGVHYQLITESVSIPAGEFSAPIQFDIILDGFESPTDLRTLVITISGAATEGVAAQNTSVEITLGYDCVSDIPLGTYVESLSGTEVELTRTEDGVYVLSQMNFRYYSPTYEDIPGYFTDSCNQLELLGVPVSEAFDIAWIGSGTYNPEDGSLSFTRADAEYNPGYFVEDVYLPVE
jgi:hypothetical protein